MYPALVLLLLPAPAVAPPAHPLPSEIARWVEELGDDRFARREAASKKLRASGEIAEAALVRALENRDAEVVRRAKAILADFKWGIYPDTPEEIVQLIRKYQASTRSEKRGVIRQLLRSGGAGCKALVKIARAEEDPLVRQEVFADVAASLSEGVASLLEENRLGELEGLLEMALAADTRGNVLHYAAYHALTGQLAARIREWEEKAKRAVVAKAENEVLAYLYRAQGEGKKAVQAAMEAEHKELIEALLYEQGNWKELAKRKDLPSTDEIAPYLGYRAAYSRLAGEKREADKILEELARRALHRAEQGENPLPEAKALLLNGRAEQALAALRKSGQQRKMEYEILTAQVRIAEARELVEKARKEDSRDLGILEILEARMLHSLGETERALGTLKKYAEQIKPKGDSPWYVDLVEAELAVGRRDEAFAVAGKVLQASTDPVWAARLLDKLYDPDGEEVLILWSILRKVEEKETALVLIQRLRNLWEGKATIKELEGWIAGAGKHSFRWSPGEIWRVLGEVCLKAKQEKRGIELLEKANSLRAGIRLGDLYAERKEWVKAAEQYLAAYRRGRETNPRTAEGEPPAALALWLSGHALERAGQIEAGKKRMAQAHLLPLGNGEMRFELVRALRQRGHLEAVKREQEALRRFGEPILSEPNSYYTGEGIRAKAIEAANRKDWLKAAEGYEQTFLRCLQPLMNFSRPQAYVTVPGHVFTQRARGLVGASRLEEARVEIGRAQGCLPASVDLAVQLVPELNKKGDKEEGTRLYESVRKTYDEVIRSYPRCAWARNQLAWMSACCGRDLEKALTHARKAVELVPDSAAYHDTLAEVLFQLGKKEEAIASQKKAIALQPKRTYFHKQLKRLEAGDPKAPRPEDEE